MAERDTPHRRRISIASRRFDDDLKRLQEAGVVGDLAILTPPPGVLTPPTATEAVPPVTGGQLPTSGQRGVRVRIPTRFRATNEKGQIYGWNVEADEVGKTDFTDGQLLAELQQALKELGYVVQINDALRLGHETVGAGRGSRHHQGKALDMNRVGPANDIRPAALDHPTRKDNPYAIRLVEWFIAHGYRAGSEAGAERAVLFGNGRWNRTPYPHHHHIHISIR